MNDSPSTASPTPPDAWEERLTALLLGELPEPEAASVRAQMAQDPELARGYDRLKATLELVRESALTPEPDAQQKPEPERLAPERRAALLASFKQAVFPTAHPLAADRSQHREWLQLAAMVVALMAVTGLLTLGLDRRDRFAQLVGLGHGPAASSVDRYELAEMESPLPAAPASAPPRDLARQTDTGNAVGERLAKQERADVSWPETAGFDDSTRERNFRGAPAPVRSEVRKQVSAQAKSGAAMTFRKSKAEPQAGGVGGADLDQKETLGIVPPGGVGSRGGAAFTVIPDPGSASVKTIETDDNRTATLPQVRLKAASGSEGVVSSAGAQPPLSGAKSNLGYAPAPGPTLGADKPVRATEMGRELSDRTLDQNSQLQRLARDSYADPDAPGKQAAPGTDSLFSFGKGLGQGGRPGAAGTLQALPQQPRLLNELAEASPSTSPAESTRRFPPLDTASGTLPATPWYRSAGGVPSVEAKQKDTVHKYFRIELPNTLTPAPAPAPAGDAKGRGLALEIKDLAQEKGRPQVSLSDLSAAASPRNTPVADKEKQLVEAVAEAEVLAKRAVPSESDAVAVVTAPTPAAAPIPQPEVQVSEDAFSTFSLNVTDVSFKLAAASLEKGKLPEVATLRSEEFINAFDYHDPEPTGSAPITFAYERSRYPFAQNRDLLRFSVKTAASGRQPGRPLNLVLLLDNSGSMERADRVQIRQECLRILASQLQPEDRVSVVAFARTARLWVDGLAGAKAGELLPRVGALTPEGGTNLEEALQLAYRTAQRHFQPQGVNRVVLLTDGAANLGDLDPASLKRSVEAQRQQGVALDCFGIGWEGYQDELLELLSRNGDGRYGFVNTPEAAASEFAGQLAGALNVAASDVKVQVEWNPRRVTTFRQVGYAKHQLKKEQFRDNSVDAAELAAAEAGNALYTVQINPRGEGPLGTVRVRFKIPGTQDYREHAWTVPYQGEAKPLEQAGSNLRLAATAAAFSEWLAGSPFAAEVTSDRLLGYLAGVPESYPADPRPKQLEWMIRQAKALSGR